MGSKSKNNGSLGKVYLLIGLIGLALAVVMVQSRQRLRSEAATTTIATLEAETMTLPSGTTVISDTNASGSQAIRFNANGSATSAINLANSATSFVVRARGDQCKGAPQLVVKVDGVQVGTAKSVSSTAWADYSYTYALSSGTHNLSVSLANYSTWKNCARRLYIDKINILGQDTSVIPTPVSGLWQPPLNSPFMWLLEHPLDVNNASDMGTGVTDYLGSPAPDPVVYDIDGFDNTASTVDTLHGKGKKVICYISAGTWENWRPDESSFPASVKGNNVGGWIGEKWLDIRQLSTLGPIMKSRLDMCKSKGFDAVEFDNVDGYTNNSGFPLTASDQLTYNRFLAVEAHNRGLSAALKNDVDQLADLWQDFDFAINEQCNQYSECGGYQTYFINNNKAVFEIEYQMSPGNFCPTMNQQNFNSLRMPIDLNGGRTPCR